jgi:hypothetical protein
MSYYKILSLNKDEEIFISNDHIKVNCDFNIKETIESDEQYKRVFNQDSFYWISGGGTFLINQRYLVVVQRNSFSSINSGKLSLFTGRADSLQEWEQPSLLKREIFEELLLYEDNKLLIPNHTLATPVYDNLAKLGIIRRNYKNKLTLKESDRIKKQSVEVNGQNEFINFHVNLKTNDVNVLSVFEIDLDIPSLSAKDGEYHLTNEKIIRHHRRIYLWDILTNELINITNSQERHHSKLNALSFEVTEHLQFIINQLKPSILN